MSQIDYHRLLVTTVTLEIWTPPSEAPTAPAEAHTTKGRQLQITCHLFRFESSYQPIPSRTNVETRPLLHKKILIVDDERVIGEELSEFLSSLDFSCHAVTSVDEALELIDADTDITLILTDMRMPGKSGADLIRTLQAIPDRTFEYVIISGHLDADQELAGIEQDSVELMRKPIDVGALMDHLDALAFDS